MRRLPHTYARYAIVRAKAWLSAATSLKHFLLFEICVSDFAGLPSGFWCRIYVIAETIESPFQLPGSLGRAQSAHVTSCAGRGCDHEQDVADEPDKRSRGCQNREPTR